MQEQAKDTPADEPPARLVTIPAHIADVFDWESYREDGMAGRLPKNMTDEAVHRGYYYKREIPEQVFAFTSWEKIPYGALEDDTKAMLRRIMAKEDRMSYEAPKEAFAVRKPLQFKRGPGG